MDSLADDASGCYVVTTVSGTRYWIDLERRLLRRVTSSVAQSSLRLRQDGADIDLLEIVRCHVGQPMVLMINLNVPGVWLTTRETTPVSRIDAVPRVMVRP
ncbi:hypothetical protein [Cryobacterium sp. PAMC25264]|uniref:hypothetical protein n=1 Tax=Cryobacterium sp. PAMC25264 TaxID=2861288 RepID=UPI001C62DA0B|nr:hypothetical protein [Cryobacterium sp. PAMC25264]QYF74362.1 hypothetical protein KY500_03910 [Cryobacterium sp. PAMC25264]